MAREQVLTDTFVELADTLVDDFDLIDFLHVLAGRCAGLLDVGAAGVMLADPHGTLQPAAASHETARLLDLFELQNQEGPCLDCYQTGQPVINVSLGEAAERWPRFAAEARAAGFVTTYALPLRLRQQVIGALNLFRTTAEEMPPESVRLGQALADAATIGILQQRAVNRGEMLATQLQEALTSRVIIEQAKGVLAERWQVHVDEAFAQLRTHARGRGRRLTDLAREVVTGTADLPPVPGP